MKLVIGLFRPRCFETVKNPVTCIVFDTSLLSGQGRDCETNAISLGRCQNFKSALNDRWDFFFFKKPRQEQLTFTLLRRFTKRWWDRLRFSVKVVRSDRIRNVRLRVWRRFALAPCVNCVFRESQRLTVGGNTGSLKRFTDTIKDTQRRWAVWRYCSGGNRQDEMEAGLYMYDTRVVICTQ